MYWQLSESGRMIDPKRDGTQSPSQLIDTMGLSKMDGSKIQDEYSAQIQNLVYKQYLFVNAINSLNCSQEEQLINIKRILKNRKYQGFDSQTGLLEIYLRLYLSSAT